MLIIDFISILILVVRPIQTMFQCNRYSYSGRHHVQQYVCTASSCPENHVPFHRLTIQLRSVPSTKICNCECCCDTGERDSKNRINCLLKRTAASEQSIQQKRKGGPEYIYTHSHFKAMPNVRRLKPRTNLVAI